MLMDDASLFRFFIRFLLQFCLYLVAQLPFIVHIDPDVFLSAFSQVHPTDGTKEKGQAWAMAPDSSLPMQLGTVAEMEALKESSDLSSRAEKRLNALIEWERRSEAASGVVALHRGITLTGPKTKSKSTSTFLTLCSHTL